MPGVAQAISSTRDSYSGDTFSKVHREELSSPFEFQRAEKFGDSLPQTPGEAFVTLLKPESGIERVFWSFEKSMFRVWTVIDRPDMHLEEKVYQAQLAFLDRMPDLECDFSVIFRFGKDFSEIRPQGSVIAFAA